MPIWRLSFEAAGFDPATVVSIYSFHRMLDDPTLNANFLLSAGPLGDILPIPLPVIRNVASIGDVFLSAGLGFFLFATVLRSRAQAVEEDAQVAASRPQRVGGHARSSAAPSGRPISASGCGRRPAWHRASPTRRRCERPALLGGSRCRPLARIGPCPDPANPDRRGRGPDPAPPVRPAGPQQLVLGAVDRPAHQPVRRPDPPDRAGVPRARADELADRGRRSSSSSRPCRTCSCRRSPERSSIAGTRRTSWSSATCSARRSSCSSRSRRSRTSSSSIR